MRYVVSDNALDTIRSECRRSPGVETGGILVGLRSAGEVTVTHATGPGPDSQRAPGHFVKDTPYLQSVLDLLFQYYHVNYLGVWHKHPPAMPFPSKGDVASAMEEVGDATMGLDELLTPICVVTREGIEVHPFVMRDGEYAEIDWESVPHDGLKSDMPLDTQWYATSAGRRRLEEEVERFEKLGVPVEVRRDGGGTYRFYAPLGGDSTLSLVTACPGEYPVVAPEIAFHDGAGGEYTPAFSPLLDRWSIHHFAADIYGDCSPTPSG